jgi:hypothetical protein
MLAMRVKHHRVTWLPEPRILIGREIQQSASSFQNTHSGAANLNLNPSPDRRIKREPHVIAAAVLSFTSTLFGTKNFRIYKCR